MTSARTPPGRWRRAAALVAVVSGLAGCSGGEDVAPAGPNVDPERLPGVQVGPAPWVPELENLRERLRMLDIPALEVEGRRMDLHVRLSVVVDGEPVTVPPGVGVNGVEEAGRMVTGFVSPLHTHDDLGFVHVHSPTLRRYTLGQVFDVWGVRFTSRCIGGYCNEGERRVRVFVDGELEGEGDPRVLPLEDEAEITVTYSASARPPAGS